MFKRGKMCQDTPAASDTGKVVTATAMEIAAGRQAAH